MTKSDCHIPFNKPYASGGELANIAQALANNHLSGDGLFSAKCHSWLEEKINTPRALLTHSGTAALEMAALLLNINPGDEVIMPSFTFVSTANAFALRGAIPVFVDIDALTMNIAPSLIEAAITAKTVAIVVVHYAGVSCDMDKIMEIAAHHKLHVIEDAAHAVLSSYKGRMLGSIGILGALSFHETKNLSCGEGGAITINDPALIERSEVIREKGTNRKQFFRGMVDKYSWIDIGSSFLPSELEAAFLWAQMESAATIQENRLASWNAYDQGFNDLEQQGHIRRPVVPADCGHNAHLYYLLVDNLDERKALQSYMQEAGIDCLPHYVPLHSSAAGRKLGRSSGSLEVTDKISDTLLRMPLWVDLPAASIDTICQTVTQFFQANSQACSSSAKKLQAVD
ncbi:MAG: dTDP-4-amino-4,6-dideoxygalactose transaminase [Candidatus Obscuribacterales bacterium]